MIQKKRCNHNNNRRLHTTYGFFFCAANEHLPVSPYTGNMNPVFESSPLDSLGWLILTQPLRSPCSLDAHLAIVQQRLLFLAQATEARME